jgi:3-hydroxyacyl-CoA dehydrogenase
VHDGTLGHKAGKGFYDWQVKDMKALAQRRDRFIVEARKIIQS